ncbi:MAG: hypothetical protein J6V00_00890 [Bacteroidaceae bacterium]|nr:hypothetical protein [Bacteroidaceae bacterium]
MKRVFSILFLLSMLLIGARAQSVIVNAEIDSVQRFIGQQAKIKLVVSYDADKHLVMPDFDKELVKGVEILESKLDTVALNDGKRYSITQEYTVTSFDTTLYVIPPFEVRVDSTSYFSQELALAVYTFPVDTANVESFFGPKDIWQVPLEWQDVKHSVYYSILLVLFVAALVWVIISYRNNKPIIRIIKIKPKIPAHIVAVNELNRIKNESDWRTSGNYKEFYVAITDALRHYLNERFGFNATEMTSDEILDNLKQHIDKDAVKELREILATADLAKFAKYKPMMNENDHNLMGIIEFVDNTKLEANNDNPQPTERRVVDKRSAMEKRWLLVGIILLSIGAIALLVLLLMDLYNIFI